MWHGGTGRAYFKNGSPGKVAPPPSGIEYAIGLSANGEKVESDILALSFLVGAVIVLVHAHAHS